MYAKDGFRVQATHSPYFAVTWKRRGGEAREGERERRRECTSVESEERSDGDRREQKASDRLAALGCGCIAPSGRRAQRVSTTKARCGGEASPEMGSLGVSRLPNYRSVLMWSSGSR